MNEVMPFVYERYRIARGPENTGLGGSSLGALISLYAVTERPGVFGRLLLESPSLFVSNRRILKHSRRCRLWPEKAFLAIGTREAGREDKDRQVVEDVRELERTLRRAGLDESRLLVKIDEGANAQRRRVGKAFPGGAEFSVCEAGRMRRYHRQLPQEAQLCGGGSVGRCYNFFTDEEFAASPNSFAGREFPARHLPDRTDC